MYTPADVVDDQPARPAKRRKVAKTRDSLSNPEDSTTFSFEPLLDGLETRECASLRKAHFEKSWSTTEARIQVWASKEAPTSMAKKTQNILDEANEDTLAEVTEFVNEAGQAE